MPPLRLWLLGVLLLAACGPTPPPTPAVSTAAVSAPPPAATATPVPASPTALPSATPTALPQIIWYAPVQTVTQSLPAEFATPTPAIAPYEIRCEANEWTLYRLADGQLLGQFNAPGCPQEVQWAPDQTVAAFPTSGQEVYIWPMADMRPIKVAQWGPETAQWMFTVLPSWAPDSQHFGFTLRPALTEPSTWPPPQIAHIVTRAGEVAATFPITGGGNGEGLFWLTNDIVCQRDSMRSPCHRASTGVSLFSIQGWHATVGMQYPQQRPSFSPDQQWALLDHITVGEAQLSSGYALSDSYQLFDLVQAAAVYTLPANNGHPLIFSGWSSDSQTAYLLHGHSRANLMTEPALPRGLLGLDVQTHALQLLFPGAEMLQWRPDHQWAWMAFTAPDAAGTERVWGGLWQPGLAQPLCQTLLAEALIYFEPAISPRLGEAGFGRPVWSHDGTRVVFGDAHGGLHLCNINGPATLLAQDESGASWLGAQFAWSPDDAHLLVQYGGQVWVVAMPIKPQ